MKTEYQEIREFFRKNKFNNIDFQAFHSFGDFYEIWQSKNMMIRLSVDKDISSIAVSPVIKSEWRDILLHRVLILNNPHELTKTLNFNEMQGFIMKHFDNLKKLYEPENVTKTLQSLADLGNTRAKLLFPSQFK